MPTTQTVVFTVLPAGRAGTGGVTRRFSVHVAPRLSGGSYLSSFSDFVEWPTIAAQMKTVRLKALTAGPAYSVLSNVSATRISADPDLELWTQLFSSPGSLPVDAFVRSAFAARFATSRFHSYPVVPLHEFHSKLFFELAQSHETRSPSPAVLVGKLKSLTGINDAQARDRVNKLFTAGFNSGESAPFSKVIPHGSSRPDASATGESPLGDHMQLQRFMEPRTSVAYMLSNPDITPPRLDFHRILAMLADHPYLMRRLGLVMDYEVAAADVLESGNFADSSFVQLDATDGWVGEVSGTKSFPRTRLNAASFLAAPKDTKRLSVSGSLDLRSAYNPTSGKGWQVISLDVEGTALKAMGLADSVARAASIVAKEAPGNAPATVDVPAPRSGGLSLVRAGRALDVVADFKRSAALLEGASAPGGAADGSGDGVELYAEDLIRGWRVDVWDSAEGKWRSITKRDQDYTVNLFPSSVSAQAVYSVPDNIVDGWLPGERPLYLTEGVISLGVTASAEPGKTDADTFVQEQVLEWTGWSLVAPRPGRTLAATTNQPVDQTTPYNEQLGLQIVTSVTPGSLPRLRYGRTYRFRLRSANLAGFGPSLQSTGSLLESAGTPSVAAPYLRYEPVPPPTIVQTQRLARGESLTNLVIYSEDEFSPVAAAGRTSRHLLPPGANAHLVELHGSLDSLAPTVAYKLLSDREGAKLIGDTDAPSWMSEPGYQTYGFAAADPGSGSAQSPVVDGDLPQPPWLVDPAAYGLRIVGPEMGTEATKYSRGALGWADARSSQVTLSGLGVNAPSALDLEDAALAGGVTTTRRFRVRVAKGEQFTISLSSLLTPSFAGHFGIVHLLKTRTPVPVSLSSRVTRVVQGLNRLVTPPTVLTVVHAVRKPLAEPRPLPISTFRQAGGTSASFGTRVLCHPQSTSQLDLRLDWTEWNDRGPTVPVETPGEGTTQPFIVNYPTPGVRPSFVALSGVSFEFGDTKHRWVRFRVTGTSRYAKYFTETVSYVLGGLGSTLDFTTSAVQPLSERVVVKVTGAVLSRAVDYSINYATGTLTMLSGAYLGKAVDIDFVPDTVTRQTTDANARYRHVPSTARPAPPVVRDVVPAFADTGWAPVKTGFLLTGRRRTRKGRILRVYLERPWFSSGDDEMLAVLLLPKPLSKAALKPGIVAAPPGTGLPKAPQQLYSSAWGRDPLRVGSPARTELNVANFPLAATSPSHSTKWVQGLSVPGTNTKVTAVPHAVKYDEEQQLWYSDIEVDLGDAYRPFIRLALARFQPYSLPDCFLSAPVLVDAAQLSPTRTLTVSGLTSLRSVSVTGPMYGSATTGVPRLAGSVSGDVPQATVPPSFEITVQHRPASYASKDDADSLGWEDIVDNDAVRRYTMSPAPGTNLNGIGRFVVSGVNVVSPNAEQAAMQVRLVIREFERDSRSLLQLAGSVFTPSLGYRRRLVFMDTYLVT